MAAQSDMQPASDRELVLSRVLKAPRNNLFRCWTEPELIKRWFTPAPWTTVHAETDLRVGGRTLIVMRSPEGQEFPNVGVYLDIVANSRLVFTDAFESAWIPSGKPYFVGDISFADAPGGTAYVARARHWTIEDAQSHAARGFHEGWGKAADQLEAVASAL